MGIEGNRRIEEKMLIW